MGRDKRRRAANALLRLARAQGQDVPDDTFFLDTAHAWTRPLAAGVTENVRDQAHAAGAMFFSPSARMFFDVTPEGIVHTLPQLD